MSEIRTRPATKEYRDNWGKVFGAKKRPRKRDAQLGEVNSVKVATSADIRRRLKEG